MTNIYLHRQGSLYTVEAEGHAAGRPDVCAAVSCLMYTLYGYALNKKGIKVRQTAIRDGYFKLSFSGGRTAALAFELISFGFVQLKHSFSETIHVFRTSRKSSPDTLSLGHGTLIPREREKNYDI